MFCLIAAKHLQEISSSADRQDHRKSVRPFKGILPTFLSSSPPTPATQSGLCGAFIPFMGFATSAVRFNGRARRAERAD